MKSPLVSSLLAVSLVGTSQAAIVAFSEDFTSATLDPMWTESGDTGTFDATNDVYTMTNSNGVGGAARLLGDAGTTTPGDYTNEINITLTDFLTPNTQTDFKWRTWGPDGFTEVVLNSFGNLRYFQTGGNLVPNTSLGLADGDSLTLQQIYDSTADTMTFSYAINGGSLTQLYSGTGNSAAFGDTITNDIDVQLLQFADVSDNPSININSWNLSASIPVVPEPSSAALLGLGGLALVLRRRK